MGKASDWLREERRKVLGDWVAVCARCGAARRWFEEFEAEVPERCPQCGGELLRRCKASDWLREERRKVLGDWVAVCAGCGAARRWFEEFEAEVPERCPQCGGEVLRRCKACGAPFSSIASVDCEECGTPLRPDELFGSPIRRRRGAGSQ